MKRWMIAAGLLVAIALAALLVLRLDLDLQGGKAVLDPFGTTWNGIEGAVTLDATIQARQVDLGAVAGSQGTDAPAHYGEDEFAVLVPSTTPEGLERFADRLCKAIAKLKIPIKSRLHRRHRLLRGRPAPHRHRRHLPAPRQAERPQRLRHLPEGHARSLTDLAPRRSARSTFGTLRGWGPMGWEALEQWGDDAARIERLAGGVANDVWSVRVGGRIAVGRLGARSDADLAWETALLRHLDREGLTVPTAIPTTDGRLFADGLVVMTYVEGGPPETEGDWRRVADTLRQLHRLTQGWPQRPGWRSSTDLLDAETGTRVDLGAMPPEGVARCRAAWARLAGRPTCVVHGDPDNPGNVRMTADRVALIDWDESHVDVPDLDLVLPHNAARLDDAALDTAAQAWAAWEAAVCWDDDYAVKRLAEVRAI